jgi:uncharacterized peroxidase-related enzyme
VESHAEFLRRVTIDEALVRAVTEDYDNAPLEPAERAMLDYASKVTVDATTVGPADHDELRRHGFDDRGILQITLITAFFAYVNRAADALGVGRD